MNIFILLNFFSYIEKLYPNFDTNYKWVRTEATFLYHNDITFIDYVFNTINSFKYLSIEEDVIVYGYYR